MTAKLHMILILIIVGVALYMFLLYKEIRIFETEIAKLKSQIASLDIALGEAKSKGLIQGGVCSIQSPTSQSIAMPQGSQALSNEIDISTVAQIKVNMVNDDNESVTSNELKDLIDNIQCVDEDQKPLNVENLNSSLEEHIIDDADVKESILRAQMEKEKIAADADEASRMLSSYTEDSLKDMKTDDLRSILRSNGVQIKGTKLELIKRILDLQSSVSNDNDNDEADE